MRRTITAILPAFNAEETVAAALDSIFKQTLPADEVIVVDDGSTDHTPRVVASHPHARHIRYMRQENAGAAAARNAGLQAATGEWIAFLDADDLWLPRRLELGVALLERHADLPWVSGAYWERPLKGPDELRGPSRRAQSMLHAGTFEDILEVFHRDALFWTSTFLIHRSCFDEVGLFEPSFVRREDVDLWLRIGLRHPRVGYVEEPIAVYRRRTSSLTHAAPELPLLGMLRHLEHRAAEVEGGVERVSSYARWLTMQSCKSWLFTGEQASLRDALTTIPQWIPPRHRGTLAIAARLPLPIYRAVSILLRTYLRLIKRLRRWSRRGSRSWSLRPGANDAHGENPPAQDDAHSESYRTELRPENRTYK